jgi:hypothetical protein
MCRVIGVMTVLLAVALEASANGTVARLCKHEQHRRTEMFTCVCSSPFIRPHINFPLFILIWATKIVFPFMAVSLFRSTLCFLSLYSAFWYIHNSLRWKVLTEKTMKITPCILVSNSQSVRIVCCFLLQERSEWRGRRCLSNIGNSTRIHVVTSQKTVSLMYSGDYKECRLLECSAE